MTGDTKKRENGHKVVHSRCFFDIEFNKTSIGRVVIELFNDLCPKTCENFRSLCTGKLN